MTAIATGVGAPRRALQSLRFRLLSAVRHEDFTRFIVLSRSRTGSNMLISLLNSHPAIIAEGEILARLQGRDGSQVVTQAYAKQPLYVKAKGFKVFYYHPLDSESDDLWEELTADDRIRVIHLKRRNILRTLVSRKIALMKDAWIATSEARMKVAGGKAAEFTTSELEQGFRRTRDWETAGDARFQGHPLLSVYYEDLIREPDGTLAQVLDFLGLQYAPLATEMRMQNAERLTDLVTNYGELKAAFAGTEWQAFFED
jgi:LPS sulfotransferase NodH